MMSYVVAQEFAWVVCAISIFLFNKPSETTIEEGVFTFRDQQVNPPISKPNKKIHIDRAST